MNFFDLSMQLTSRKKTLEVCTLDILRGLPWDFRRPPPTPMKIQKDHPAPAPSPAQKAQIFVACLCARFDSLLAKEIRYGYTERIYVLHVVICYASAKITSDYSWAFWSHMFPNFYHAFFPQTARHPSIQNVRKITPTQNDRHPTLDRIPEKDSPHKTTYFPIPSRFS